MLLERAQVRSVSLCVRKSVPLQTPKITPFFVFAIYKIYFPNIFANVLYLIGTDSLEAQVIADNMQAAFALPSL